MEQPSVRSFKNDLKILDHFLKFHAPIIQNLETTAIPQIRVVTWVYVVCIHLWER